MGGASGRGEPPGSVAEEAARLYQAVQEWARRHGAGEAGGDPLAGRSPTGQPHGVATGSPECGLCPVCQLLSVLRETRPEVFDHLAAATASMAAALRELRAATDRERANRAGGVQHIDIG